MQVSRRVRFCAARPQSVRSLTFIRPPCGRPPYVATMLDLLRRHSRSWLIWAIFIVLILVFIFFFGPQTEGFAPSNRTWALRIDGHTYYDTQLNAAVQRQMDRSGDRTRMEDAEFNLRRRQVADDISLIYLLADRARSHGLQVSKDELACYIVNWSDDYLQGDTPICAQFPEAWRRQYRNADIVFYTTQEGAFSTSYRNDVRGYFAMSVDEYEDFKRRELLALRYLDLLAAALPVPDALLAEAVRRRSTERNYEFVRVSGDIDLLTIDSDAVETILRDEEGLLRERYATGQDRYTTPRRIRLQQIYVSRSEDSDAAAAERARLESLLATAREEGTDFAALVAEHTELARERESGGDLGWRTRDAIASDLWDAAEALQVGEVALVEQARSWRIIRLAELEEGRVLPFDEVRGDLASELATERARARIVEERRHRAEGVLARAREGASFADAIAALDESELEAQETGFFPLERVGQSFPEFGFVLPAPPPGDVPTIGLAPSLRRAMDALTVESPLAPSLIEHEGSLFAVRMIEERTVDNVEALRAQVMSDLQRELADNLFALSTVRVRLTTNARDIAFPELLQGILDEAIARGRIRLRRQVFDATPSALGVALPTSFRP